MRRILTAQLITGLLIAGIFGLLVLLYALSDRLATTVDEQARVDAMRVEVDRSVAQLEQVIDHLGNSARRYALSRRASGIQRLNESSRVMHQLLSPSADWLDQLASIKLDESLANARLALDQYVDTLVEAVDGESGAVETRLLALDEPSVLEAQRALRQAIKTLSHELDGPISAQREHIKARRQMLAVVQQIAIAATAALLLICALVLTFGLFRPMATLDAGLRRIGSGHYEHKLATTGLKEAQTLADRINWLGSSVSQDLAIRAEAERTAQAVERRLQELSDMAPSVIWEFRFHPGKGPEVSYSSQAFEDYYSVTRDQVMANFASLFASIHDQDLEDYVGEMERALIERRGFSNEHRARRPEGGYRWVRSIARSTRLPDGTTVWNGYTADIHELKELKSRLELALAGAEHANQAKSEFIANISHEIRTPMNAVLGMSHLCMQTTLTNKQRDYIIKIENSARMLLRMINNVLDSAKMEAGRLELEEIEFSLDQVLDNVSNIVAVRARDKSLQLLFDVPADVPRELIGDGMRLGQVLMNLAGNAVKFTTEGEIRIAIRELERTHDTTRLVFEVSDTGIGIAPEHIHRLFQSFSQADASTTRKFGGTGLGLMISRQLVELLGGDIRVDSVPGRGTRFTFTAAFSSREGKQTALEETAEGLGALRCLVVDQYKPGREILAATLESLGFSVRTAESGEQTLREVLQHSFDCILLDWDIGDLSCLEVASKVRATEGEPAQVFLTTALSRDQLPEDVARSEHIEGVLIKPINATQLLESITSRFKGAAGQTQRAATTFEAPRFNDMTLLIADDAEINLDMLRELIETTGASVVAVQDGDEAVTMASEQEFDLVLLDLHMDRMDGVEAAQAIRENLVDRCPPIIALTGDDSAQTKAICLKAGMNDYLLKPVAVDLLYATIGRYSASGTVVASADKDREDNLGLPKITGVNVRDGLARSNYNEKLYILLLRKLISRYSSIVHTVQTHVDEGRWRDIGALGHAIKGSSANLSAESIATIAKKMELAAEEENPAVALECAKDIQAVLKRMSMDLPMEQATTRQLALKELPPQDLARVAELIRSGDTSARRIVQELRQQVGDHAILMRLDGHLGRYEFDQALALIRASATETPA